MPDKAKFTVGVFAGIMRPDGLLLLQRRVEEDSIIPGQSFVGNWELPGGGVMEQESSISYALLSRELMREVIEETGLTITVDPMPTFYPTPFKGPNGYDLSLVTPVEIDYDLPTKGDHIWVSPENLNQLAREFIAPKKNPRVEAKGLLSGYGKRMHCMALAALTRSPNPIYSNDARQTLEEIQKSW